MTFALRHAPEPLRALPGEAYFWAAALVGVACLDPQGGLPVNLCLIEQVGLPCPGDGLGTAIAHLARGQWAASWAAHPLGSPVVGVLLYHIGTLCREALRRPLPPPSHSPSLRPSAHVQGSEVPSRTRRGRTSRSGPPAQ